MINNQVLCIRENDGKVPVFFFTNIYIILHYMYVLLQNACSLYYAQPERTTVVWSSTN